MKPKRRNQSIAMLLKKAYREGRTTRKEVAFETGAHWTTVRKWEQSYPPEPLLRYTDGLARALGCPIPKVRRAIEAAWDKLSLAKREALEQEYIDRRTVEMEPLAATLPAYLKSIQADSIPRSREQEIRRILNQLKPYVDQYAD